MKLGKLNGMISGFQDLYYYVELSLHIGHMTPSMHMHSISKQGKIDLFLHLYKEKADGAQNEIAEIKN